MTIINMIYVQLKSACLYFYINHSKLLFSLLSEVIRAQTLDTIVWLLFELLLLQIPKNTF